jgi:Domain of Unknown Function (DUF1206)
MRTVAGPEGWEAVERAGRRTARRPWVQLVARVGFAARGVVAAVIGVLALSLAAGAGGRTTDTKGALATIASASAGRIAVALLGAGFAALAAWLVLGAIAETDGRNRSGWMAAAVRVGRAISGLAYGSLAVAALRLALQRPAGRGGDEAARTWTARALELPLGRALVMGGAAVALIVGGKQLWVGLRRSFLKDLELGRMSARLRAWASRTGMVGITTQGVVFVLVGLFFAQAALERDPGEATGFDGALQTIARQPLGMALLGVTALGLLAYAAYAFIEGAHRKLA